MAGICSTRILKKYAGIEPKILEELDASIAELYKSDLSPEKFDEAVRELTADTIRASAQDIAVKLDIARKAKRIINYVRQPVFQGNNAAEGLASLLDASDQQVLGGSKSVSGYSKALRGDYYSSLYSSLIDKGGEHTVKIFESSAKQKEIMVELFYLDQPGGTGEMQGKDKVAFDIAQAIHNTYNRMHADKLKSGQYAPRSTGYIMGQIHNADLVRGASFDEWFEKAVSAFKLSDTFLESASFKAKGKEAQVVAIKKEYQRIYNRIIADESPFLSKGPGRRARSLEPVNPEAFFDYNQAFGTKNISEFVIDRINKEATTNGRAFVLGAEPKKMWDFAMKEVMRDSASSAAVSKHRGMLDRMASLAIGGTRQELNLFGQYMREFRNAVAASKLGFAGINAVTTDIATSAAAMSTFTGKGGVSSFVDSMVDTMSQVSEGSRQRIYKKTEMFFSDFLAEPEIKMDQRDIGKGIGSKMLGWTTRIGLMQNLTSASKSANGIGLARQIAYELKHGNIDPRTQSLLMKYGLNNHVELLRSSIENLAGDDIVHASAFREAAERSGIKASDARELEISYKAMLNDFASTGSPTPGLRESAVMAQFDPNTFWGQAVLAIGQFKSFPLAMKRVFTKIGLHGQSGLTGKDILKFKGNNDALAYLAAVTTVAGLASLTASNLLNNKEAPKLDDPATWKQAFLRGGAGFIVADMLLSDYHGGGQSVMRLAASPTTQAIADIVGSGTHVYEIAKQVMQGGHMDSDSDERAQKILKSLASNVPGQNLFFIKGAMDHMVLDNIFQFVNPRYLDEKRRNMERRNQAPLFE